MEVNTKVCKCNFCGERYELDSYDNDRTHIRFCGGDCQYAGEVLPDFIRSTTGEEKKHWEEELKNYRKKFNSITNL